MEAHMKHSLGAVLLCVLVCGATALNVQSPIENVTITSGVIWNDDAGNPVHAHGLGMILPSAPPAGAGGLTACNHMHWLTLRQTLRPFLHYSQLTPCSVAGWLFWCASAAVAALSVLLCLVRVQYECMSVVRLATTAPTAARSRCHFDLLRPRCDHAAHNTAFKLLHLAVTFMQPDISSFRSPIFPTGGKYYMVGTTKKHNPHWLSSGINMYSTTDLQNWHSEAQIFQNTSITTPLSEGTQYRIERLKVIWNAKTKLYVMYFHLDSAAFRMGMVGVATCESIAGVYKYVHGFQPDGQRPLDMGLGQETDGRAYLVRSVDNKYAGFSQLSEDYLNTTGIVSRGPKCEGQAVWREGETYYLLGSHLTGWSSNPAILATAQAPLTGAKWTVLGNPSGSSTTFNSHCTYVLPYTHPSTGKQLLIYMGDRWNAGHPPNEYIWLPMVKNGSDPSGFQMAPLDGNLSIHFCHELIELTRLVNRIQNLDELVIEIRLDELV